MFPLRDFRAGKGRAQDPGTPNAENVTPHYWEGSVPRGSRAREHAAGQHGLHGTGAAGLHQPARPTSLRHPVASGSHPPLSSTAVRGHRARGKGARKRAG